MNVESRSSSIKLGRLERVDLRDAWINEAENFTPWLAQEDNLALLSETIKIDLELEAQEKNVGPFRADILCRDTLKSSDDDHWVLIENQLEQTDHVHMGQLMTYAAGLNAVTIVWIASRFRAEHRKALDWLNEMTSTEIAFFGLEVELWRIGNSPMAPKFNVVSSPNDWAKQVSQGAKKVASPELTETKQKQIRFWSGFREHIDEVGASFQPTKALPQHWMNISIGRSGFKTNAIVSFWNAEQQRKDLPSIRAELELTDKHSKTYYAQLLEIKDEIEEDLGEPLTWYNPPDSQVCRLYVSHTAELEEESQWPISYAWLKEKLEALRRVFADRIKTLSTDYQILAQDE